MVNPPKLYQFSGPWKGLNKYNQDYVLKNKISLKKKYNLF